MTGRADVARAPGLHRFEGAALHLGNRRILGGLDPCVPVDVVAASDAHRVSATGGPLERVVEAFIAEIAFVFGDPLLKSAVRLDLEWTHRRAVVLPACES